MCLSFLFGPKGLGKPFGVESRSITEISSLLLSELPDCSFRFLDSRYRVVPFGEYVRFVNWDKSDSNIYVPEDLDCDNFAISLWGSLKGTPRWSGLALGYCEVETSSGGLHAVNIFVDVDGVVFFVEPQNDLYWTVASKKDWVPYFVMI